MAPGSAHEDARMTPITIGLLALTMSIDAFVASIGRGAVRQGAPLASALRTGAVFGLVETVTPLLGWALGVVASQYVQAFDHWIAFALLGLVGMRTIIHAGQRDGDGGAPRLHSPLALLATAIGTSVDAMAVGVSLAFIDVDIVIIALAIGLATMTMSTTGALTGRLLGQRFGRSIEVFGGLILIGLGLAILLQHLTA